MNIQEKSYNLFISAVDRTSVACRRADFELPTDAGIGFQMDKDSRSISLIRDRGISLIREARCCPIQRPNADIVQTFYGDANLGAP